MFQDEHLIRNSSDLTRLCNSTFTDLLFKLLLAKNV